MILVPASDRIMHGLEACTGVAELMAEGRFTGRSALVTGAAQGIGRAIAERLAREGGSILLVDIEGDLAEQTAAELRAGGGIAEAIDGDIARQSDVRRAVDAAWSALAGSTSWPPTPGSPMGSRSRRSTRRAGVASSTSI